MLPHLRDKKKGTYMKRLSAFSVLEGFVTGFIFSIITSYANSVFFWNSTFVDILILLAAIAIPSVFFYKTLKQTSNPQAVFNCLLWSFVGFVIFSALDFLRLMLTSFALFPMVDNPAQGLIIMLIGVIFLVSMIIIRTILIILRIRAHKRN